ncbi:MAG: hypothetical protein J6W42_01895 [Bacteroidaceae bacterium]|nr:hypothetical protein [Bacteroidaceae bacterium]
MKKVSIILTVVALCVLTASCGVLGAGGNGSGSVNGQQSGAALKSLYSQYKTDGKVDLTNLNNVISMAQLVNGIQGLKGIDDKSRFYTDFATGLILGSNNLVTQQTSNPVTNTLQTLVSGTDLTAIAAAGLAAAAQTQQAQQAATQTQQAATQTQQAAATTGNNVANTVAAISETTAGVSNTLSSLATIFSLFGGGN